SGLASVNVESDKAATTVGLDLEEGLGATIFFGLFKNFFHIIRRAYLLVVDRGDLLASLETAGCSIGVRIDIRYAQSVAVLSRSDSYTKARQCLFAGWLLFVTLRGTWRRGGSLIAGKIAKRDRNGLRLAIAPQGDFDL